MSQIAYNNVVLQIVRTHTFRQESVYDPSDTDMMRMKFTVGVQAVVSIAASTSGTIAPAVLGETPVATMSRIRHLLAVPRRAFAMSVAGQTLLQVVVPPDAANGPKPRVLSITRISDTMFLVDWQCELNIVECDSSAGTPYVSLRWSQSVTYDRRWYATVRTAGSLVVNSSLLANPDSLRALVTPPIPDGFQRMPARYVLSEDGLKLSFEFTDVQAFHLPLAPALRCTGKVGIVSGEGAGAPVRSLMLSLRMEGGPGTLKSDLVTAALSVFLMYANAAGGLFVGNAGYLFQGGVSCDVWDNIIELQVSARLNPPGKDNALALNTGFVDVNPNSGSLAAGAFDGSGAPPEAGIAPPLQGQSEFLGLMAAAFNDMCLAGSSPTAQQAAAGSFSQSAWPGTGGDDSPLAGQGLAPSQSSLSIGNVNIDPNPADYYADNLPGVYEFYKIHNAYKTNSNLAILAPTSSSSSALIAVVALAKPVLTLISCWTAEKIGAPPELPPSAPPDNNTVLLDTVIEPEEIQVTQDLANIRYTISGRYEYVFLDASKVDPTAPPIPPYLTSQIASAIDDYTEADNETLWGDESTSGSGNVGLNP